LRKGFFSTLCTILYVLFVVVACNNDSSSSNGSGTIPVELHCIWEELEPSNDFVINFIEFRSNQVQFGMKIGSNPTEWGMLCDAFVNNGVVTFDFVGLNSRLWESYKISGDILTAVDSNSLVEVKYTKVE